MFVLTLRTDNPEAELGLYDDSQKIAYESWLAHRELAETIHLKMQSFLASEGKTLRDIQGIVVFRGPGSFTGLRIGITVANALASGYSLPIVGSEGDDWISQGIVRLLNSENEVIAMPEYGALPNITAPRK